MAAGGHEGIPTSPSVTPTLAEEASPHRERFTEAYERHYGKLLEYLVRRTGSLRDSEDIATAVFATAWRKVEQLPDEPDTRAWLFWIARRELSNSWRSMQRRRRLVSKVGGAEAMHARDPADATVERGTIHAAFDRLRRKDQEILVLIYWDEVSRAEAARILNCTVEALDVRLHRARNALAQSIDYVSRQSATRAEDRSENV